MKISNSTLVLYILPVVYFVRKNYNPQTFLFETIALVVVNKPGNFSSAWVGWEFQKPEEWRYKCNCYWKKKKTPYPTPNI